MKFTPGYAVCLGVAIATSSGTPTIAQEARKLEVLYFQAQQDLALFHFDDAIAKLRKIEAQTKHEPLKQMARFNIATAYKTQGYVNMHDFPVKAIPYFQKALEIVPDHDAMQKLGLAYCNLKQWKPCIQAYTDAISLTNNDDKHLALYIRGIARETIPGQTQLAIRDYRDAAEMARQQGKPDVAKNYIQAAVLLER